MTLYKVLNEDGSCRNGGSGCWKLGEWQEVEGELVLCENALHLCDGEKQLLEWIGPVICKAEYEGERLDADDKIGVRRARTIHKIDNWNERTARLFACDCAEHVLHLFEDEYPDDKRVRLAIETARRYANGEATDEELIAACHAAWDIAWAARAAARAAAWDADRAARTATRAARAAARDAAWDADSYAAWAAEDAEREWQADRLRQYLEGEL